MRANNLTISVSAPKCTKNCPFCISKMTPAVEEDNVTFLANLPILKTIVQTAQVSSILITSKNEPMDNRDFVFRVSNFFKDYPTELQTNGIRLRDDPSALRGLVANPVNIVAISINSPEELHSFIQTFVELSRNGFLIRLTIILNDAWKNEGYSDILRFCNDYHIRQLTFRVPTVPVVRVSSPASDKIEKWINRHNTGYDHITYNLAEECTADSFVRTLPFGAHIYDVRGVGVTVMDYCIQENSNSEDIRSLIYQHDGHLYTTWDKKGSIIF
jgi:uncharacterized Fe-S cluster-containing radical SAM superfamily protein